MRQRTVVVKSRKEPLGECHYVEYDSVAESIDQRGEAVILELVNSQEKTNKMNQFRAEKGGKPSIKKLRAQALGEATPEELQSIAGDPQAIEDFIETKLRELKKQYGIDSDDNEDD